MEADEYFRRYKAIKAYPDKAKLLEDLTTEDTELRKLFSQQRDSWVVPELTSPNQSLVPVFGREEYYRCVELFEEEKAIPKVFQLGKNRKVVGESCVVSKEVFKRNFEEVFCENQLRYLNWQNVFAAGGSVMACVQPLPPDKDDCNRSRRKYMHDEAFPGSDIDLFLYGLNADQAKKKIVEIYDSVRESNPFDIICFRSSHSVSLVSQYPFRHIQIVLRLYSSPSEVLTGFDVDSCAVGYDGQQVWMANRCHMALTDQINRINLLRRSPTYEMRLAKYAPRGFEVAVPNLKRGRIDPMLMERAWNKVQGLGKLLLLEKLKTPEARFRYKEQHRSKQMRRLFTSSMARKFQFNRMINNRWNSVRMEGFQGGAEASDYSVVFLPWGPGYDAQKCRKLMSAKDMLLNNSYVNKNRGYYLHPCFYGTAEEILKDCAPNDPPLPEDVDKEQLKGYVRGELSFIEDDPGRQMIGSFHPITDTDWVSGAYISEETENLCITANANDISTLNTMLQSGVNPNATDFAGRSALHIATLSNAVDCAKALIDAGSKISYKMPDGRNSLHIACAYGHSKIVGMLLEKSRANAVAAEKEESGMEVDEEAEDEFVEVTTTEGQEQQAKEHDQDVIDLNSTDWNHKMTPLHYAVTFGHVEIVRNLLKEDVDATKGWIVGEDKLSSHVISPLVLVSRLFQWLPNAADEILQLLLNNGCKATQLDLSLNSVLHTAAEEGNHKFMAAVLKYCPDVVKCISVINTFLQTPLLVAVSQQSIQCTRLLLEAGAKPWLTEQDCDLARRRFNSLKDKRKSDWNIRNLLKITSKDVQTPLQLAVLTLLNISKEADLGILDKAEEDAAVGGKKETDKDTSDHDPLEMVKLLVQHKADINQIIINGNQHFYRSSYGLFGSRYSSVEQKSTVLDQVQQQLSQEEQLVKTDKEEIQKALGNTIEDLAQRLSIVEVANSSGDKRPQPTVHIKVGEHLKSLQTAHKDSYLLPTMETLALMDDIQYLYGLGSLQLRVEEGWGKQSRLRVAKELEKFLLSKGAKTFQELQPKEAKKQKKKLEDEEKEQYHYRSRRYGSSFTNYVLQQVVSVFKNFPQIEKAWDKFTQYSLLAEERHSFSFNEDSEALLLSKKQQIDCHELFENVWNKQGSLVESSSMKEGENTVYVAVQNNKLKITPFILAVLRNDKMMMDYLIKVCIRQYQPREEHRTIGKKWAQEDEQDDFRVGNYALQYALMDGYYEEDFSDYEDEDEGQDDDDDDGDHGAYDSMVQEMKEAREAEELKEQELLDADEGIAIETVEAVDTQTTTHVLPHRFYFTQSCVPMTLVGDYVQEDWKQKFEDDLNNLWKAVVQQDKQSFKKICDNHESFGGGGPNNPRLWVELYPLQIAIWRKDMDMLKHIMESTLMMDGMVKEQLGSLASSEQQEETEKKHKKGYSEDSEDDEESNVKKKQLDPLSFARKVASVSKAIPLAICQDNVQVLEYFSKLIGIHNYVQLARQYQSSMRSQTKNYKRWYKDAEFIYRIDIPTSVMLCAIQSRSKKVIEWLLGGNAGRALSDLCQKHNNVNQACSKLAELFKQYSDYEITQSEPVKIIEEMMFLGFLKNKDAPQKDAKQYFKQKNECVQEFIYATFQKSDLGTELLEWFVTKCREYGYGKRIDEALQERGLLMRAVQFNNPKLLELLLDWSLDPLEVEQSDRGWNVLALILHQFMNNYTEKEVNLGERMLKSVMEHEKVSESQRQQLITMKMGKYKQSLLSIFSYQSMTDSKQRSILDGVVKLIPKEMFTQRDIEGRTALHIATTNQQVRTVYKLTEEESKVAKPDDILSVVVENNVGLTPMDISMNHLCDKTGVKSQSHTQKRKCQEDKMQDVSVAGMYKTVLKMSSKNKQRRYPTFEEVQESFAMAVDAVNEEEENDNVRRFSKVKKYTKTITLSAQDDGFNRYEFASDTTNGCLPVCRFL